MSRQPLQDAPRSWLSFGHSDGREMNIGSDQMFDLVTWAMGKMEADQQAPKPPRMMIDPHGGPHAECSECTGVCIPVDDA